jgi:poly(A) polymerase
LSVSKLFFVKKEDDLENKDLNFWWFENKDIAAHLFLLTAADSKATSEDENFLKQLIDFIKYMQDYYFNVYKKEIIEDPLLSGKEIMEILNIKPSPLIGQIKEKLIKAQIEGSVRNKEEAINFVRSLL